MQPEKSECASKSVFGELLCPKHAGVQVNTMQFRNKLWNPNE